MAIVAVEGVRRGERCGARGTLPVRAASERAGTVRSTVPVGVWRSEHAPAERNVWEIKLFRRERFPADVHVRRGLNASRAFEDPAVSNRAGYFLTDRTRTPLSSDRSNAVFRSTRDHQTRRSAPSSSPLSSRSKSSSRGDRIGGTWCASGVSGSEAHAKRHDEDRGGPVDDQEAARGHAHPHQGEPGDDRERDRNLRSPNRHPNN